MPDAVKVVIEAELNPAEQHVVKPRPFAALLAEQSPARRRHEQRRHADQNNDIYRNWSGQSDGQLRRGLRLAAR